MTVLSDATTSDTVLESLHIRVGFEFDSPTRTWSAAARKA